MVTEKSEVGQDLDLGLTGRKESTTDLDLPDQNQGMNDNIQSKSSRETEAGNNPAEDDNYVIKTTKHLVMMETNLELPLGEKNESTEAVTSFQSPMKQNRVEEKGDKNTNSDNPYIQHTDEKVVISSVSEEAALSPASLGDEKSVSMEVNVVSSENSVISEVAPQSSHQPIGSGTTDCFETSSAPAMDMSVSSMHTIEGAAEPLLGSGSKTDGAETPQAITVNDESKQIIDNQGSGSEDFDGIDKHNETSSGNDRKRKMEASEKPDNAKKEKKREKFLAEQKGGIHENDKDINSLPDKQNKANDNEERMNPPNYVEPVQEQNNDVQINEEVKNADRTFPLSTETSNITLGKQVSHLQNQDESEIILTGGDSNKDKIFGGFFDNKTDLNSTVKENETPSQGSLFQLNKKITKDSDINKQDASLNADAGTSDQTKKSVDSSKAQTKSRQEDQEKSGKEQQNGVRTRSMTKKKENDQKKNSSEPKVK